VHPAAEASRRPRCTPSAAVLVSTFGRTDPGLARPPHGLQVHSHPAPESRHSQGISAGSNGISEQLFVSTAGTASAGRDHRLLRLCCNVPPRGKRTSEAPLSRSPWCRSRGSISLLLFTQVNLPGAVHTGHTGRARTILISFSGLSCASVCTLPRRLTTSIPEHTRPKMVCFPSSHGVGARLMKN